MEWTNKSVEDRGGGIVVSMIAFYSYDSSNEPGVGKFKRKEKRSTA